MTATETWQLGAILSELAVCRQAESGLHGFLSLPHVLFLHAVFIFTFCYNNDSLCLKAVTMNFSEASKAKNAS